VHVSVLSDLGKWIGETIGPDDAEVVKKTLARIDEQDKWNDVFSTKLIELLDNIDGLKKEIRERMRRVEKIKLVESILLDEAARTEALNAKLSETEKALEYLRLEFLKARDQYQGAESLRKEANEIIAEGASRYREARGLADDASHAYKNAEEIGRSSADAYKESGLQLHLSFQRFEEAGKSLAESAASLSSASQRLERAEHTQAEASKKSIEAKGLLDQSIVQLSLARATEERAAGDFRAARQDLVSSQQRLTSASEFFRKATNWVIYASVLSWTAVVWMVWFTFRPILHVWEPCITTALLVFAGILVLRGVKREAGVQQTLGIGDS
jgi:hypothetical protein